MTDISSNEKAYRLRAGGSPFIILEPHHGERTDITRLRRPKLEQFLTRAYKHVNPELEAARDSKVIYAFRPAGQDGTIDVKHRNYRFAGMNTRGQVRFAFDAVTQDGQPLGTHEERAWPLQVMDRLSYTNSEHFLCRPREQQFLRGAHFQAARHLVRSGAFE